MDALLLGVYLLKKNKRVMLWMCDNITWGVLSQAVRVALLSNLPNRKGDQSTWDAWYGWSVCAKPYL